MKIEIQKTIVQAKSRALRTGWTMQPWNNPLISSTYGLPKEISSRAMSMSDLVKVYHLTNHGHHVPFYQNSDALEEAVEWCKAHGGEYFASRYRIPLKKERFDTELIIRAETNNRDTTRYYQIGDYDIENEIDHALQWDAMFQSHSEPVAVHHFFFWEKDSALMFKLRWGGQ